MLREIDIYTDGACSGNHLLGKQGRMGAGIVAKCGPVVRAWGLPLGPGTNQRAELLAVREALYRLRNRGEASVTVLTDSEYAIGCLTKNWKVKANTDLVDEIRVLVRECGRFRMLKVPGHAGHPENERADELAVRAALTGEPITER